MIIPHRISEYLGHAGFGCLYAIGPKRSSVLKVGFAGNVRTRHMDLQVGNWRPLFIHAVWWFQRRRVAEAMEGAVQAALADALIRGEWYRASLARVQGHVSDIAHARGTAFMSQGDIDFVVSRAI